MNEIQIKNNGFFQLLMFLTNHDFQNARNYWKVLKKEGNETVTNCNRLKLISQDGKKRLTDVADTEQLLRLNLGERSATSGPINPDYKRRDQGLVQRCG